MSLARGFLVTILSGLVGGVIGAIIGFCLGRFTPDYYRMVFDVRPGMKFDAVQVGVGLGITQGMGGGLFVGVAIVSLSAWLATRSRVDPEQRRIPPQ